MERKRYAFDRQKVPADTLSGYWFPVTFRSKRLEIMFFTQLFQECRRFIGYRTGTVFAYGATGAGKTYTMSGREQIAGEGGLANGRSGRSTACSSRESSHGGNTDGLIPRSMRYIFKKIAALPDGVKMRIRASYYEIYNEFVYDLLAQGERHPLPVNILECKRAQNAMRSMY